MKRIWLMSLGTALFFALLFPLAVTAQICPNPCNGICILQCLPGQDPDCRCASGNGCCGDGCTPASDSDCCDGSCPAGFTVAQDPDCGCRDGDGCCGIGCIYDMDHDCGAPPPPPPGPSAFPTAAQPECAKLRRTATDVNPDCLKDRVVGYDENLDKKIKCDLVALPPVLPAPGTCSGNFCNLSDWGACALVSNIRFAVDFVFWGFLLISLIFFVWGGFTMMNAQGDPEKFATGRRFILYGAIGVLVAIGSRLIPAIVTGIIGI